MYHIANTEGGLLSSGYNRPRLWARQLFLCTTFIYVFCQLQKKKTKTDCLIALSAGLVRAVPQANRCAVSSFFVATTVRLLLQSSRMGPFTQNMMLMTPPGVCDAYRVLLCILIDTSFQLLLMDKKINSNITPWLLGWSCLSLGL